MLYIIKYFKYGEWGLGLGILGIDMDPKNKH